MARVPALAKERVIKKIILGVEIRQRQVRLSFRKLFLFQDISILQLCRKKTKPESSPHRETHREQSADRGGGNRGSSRPGVRTRAARRDVGMAECQDSSQLRVTYITNDCGPGSGVTAARRTDEERERKGMRWRARIRWWSDASGVASFVKSSIRRSRASITIF